MCAIVCMCSKVTFWTCVCGSGCVCFLHIMTLRVCGWMRVHLHLQATCCIGTLVAVLLCMYHLFPRMLILKMHWINPSNWTTLNQKNILTTCLCVCISLGSCVCVRFVKKCNFYGFGWGFVLSNLSISTQCLQTCSKTTLQNPIWESIYFSISTLVTCMFYSLNACPCFHHWFTNPRADEM